MAFGNKIRMTWKGRIRYTAPPAMIFSEDNSGSDSSSGGLFQDCPKCGSTFAGLTCPKCEAEDLAPPELKPGESCAGLEVQEIVGRGGMGVVYRCRDPRLDRTVALKTLLRLDPRALARFTREAESLASLTHPNIVRIFDFKGRENPPFLVLEFVKGRTLRERMKEGPLSPDESRRIALSLCDALVHAHARGIIHRDIKPGNVLLTPEGNVKLTDFGLAKEISAGAGLTVPGARLGTANYMAPEQMEDSGKVDHRADIYALGVLLHEMMTGELPGKRLDFPLAPVVRRMMAANPGDRPPDMKSVRSDLQGTEVPQTARPETSAGPGKQKKIPLFPILIATLVIAGIVLGIFLLKPEDREEVPASGPIPERFLPESTEDALPADSILSPNPLFARTEKEISALDQHLRKIGISTGKLDIKAGYAIRWPGCEEVLLVGDTPHDFMVKADQSNQFRVQWMHFEEKMVILVFAYRRIYRAEFLEVIRRIQTRAGLELKLPVLTMEELVPRPEDLRAGWRVTTTPLPGTRYRLPLLAKSENERNQIIDLPLPCPKPSSGDLDAFYCTKLSSSSAEKSFYYLAMKFHEEEKLAGYRKTLDQFESANPGSIQVRIFGRFVAVFTSGDAATLKHFADMVNGWMGGE